MINKQYRLFTALMLASSAALAGYSTDPECKAVSDGAQAGADRILGRIDTVASSTSQAVAGAKSCVDQVLEQANRSVPDFGGGSFGQLSQYASAALARQGCQMISNAQAQALNQVPSQAQPVVRDAAVTLGNGGQPAPSSVFPQPSIWQRLANVF